MKDFLKRFCKEEDGVAMVDVIVVIVVLLAIIFILRGAIMDFANNLIDQIAGIL